MRFIKKASFNNLSELSKVYKEFELHTNRDDFAETKIRENLEIIKEVYAKNGAIVTAIHCPSSKYKTSFDKEGELYTNYMSWCEIIGDQDEYKLFVSICKFTEEIAKIYNSTNDKSESLKNNNTEDEEDDDNEEAEENQKQNSEHKIKILIILHTGCVIGCDDHPEFKCPINITVSETRFKNFDISEFYNGIQKFQNIQIGFENITPFSDANGTIGSNSGYGYENFILAKNLNQTYKTNMFGVVVDFCHIFANCKLLGIRVDKNEYFKNYMDAISDEQKKLIHLFHLSKYDETNNIHGGIFTDSKEDQTTIASIRDWCLKNSRNKPITLEVMDSQDVVEGSNNFYKVMLEWSKLHILIKDKVEDDLYQFFESLHELYSLQFNKKTKNMVTDIACKVRQIILEKSQIGNKLFGFDNEKQNLDIHLIQVQAYIYYMRYCNLAIDLLEKYENRANVNITSVLSHYIFNDKLEEVRFDGLGSYYKIHWIKSNTNLYRCYDGCTGRGNKEKQFSKIIQKCFEHIGGSFNETQYLSFSKSFERVMSKYYNRQKLKYNIEIIKNSPINCILVEDRWITLQEYQDYQKDYTNFSIDFSDFYNDRGDKGKEASLKELYEKVCGENSWRDSAIGSIYDQEVILHSSDNLAIQRYYINELEFIIMMVAYSIILNWDNKKVVISVNSVVDKTSDSQSLLNDNFVTSYNKYSIKISNIKDILNVVDFEYERKNRISTNNDGFSDFAKDFIPWYESINKQGFYNEIISQLKNKGGEDDVSK